MNSNKQSGVIIGVLIAVVILLVLAGLVMNGYIPGIGPRTVVVLSTTTSDPCSQQSLAAAVPEVDKLTRAYDDSVRIAETLPGDQLAPIVSQLQTVRRSAEDLNVPSCMQNLKQLQLNYMNTYIDAMLYFGQNYSGIATASALNSYASAVAGTQTPVPLIAAYIAQGNQLSGTLNQGIAQALNFHQLYEAERARLLGITLTPTLIPIQPPDTFTPAPATPTP